GSPVDANETALPRSPGEEGDLPRTLSGEPYPAPPADQPADESEPEPDESADEEGDTPPGERPFDSAEAIPFALGDELPFDGGTPAGASPAMAHGVAVLTRPHDPFANERTVGTRVSGPEELEPDPALERLLITQERIDALWDEINDTYNVVIMDVRGYYRTTEAAIADLKRARELLLAGEAHFDNAEQLVKSVKARLRLEEKVRQWSRTRGTWLAIYLITWLMVLAGATLMSSRVFEAATQLVPQWMAATFLPALYGGLGGVVGALWVLIKHIVKERDFDPIHTPWYILNPFMGVALGAITYFLLRASALILGTSPVSLGDPSEQFGLYFLAIVVGFNQNVLWALIDRVIKAIIPPAEESSPAERAVVSEPSQD
ncbi:MAG TPA: hypothetical protein PK801_14415, partial [Aggregatilineales bacterium]|nr:hypothetical protein [Aggregatilineales bacterium]